MTTKVLKIIQRVKRDLHEVLLKLFTVLLVYLLNKRMPGASFITTVPRTNLKSVYGNFLGYA